jgi:adenine/guanine phosphoribosyltransferase-like PRPP-binding protein
MASNKTLFVTDFDDTLAMTDANVILVRKGEKTSLTPAEFAVYEPAPGDNFDFSEFDQLINPRPIQRFVKLLQKAVHENRADKVVVLTARNHTRPVAQFLKMIGIESGVAIAALGDANPQKKARYIEKQIQDGYGRVLFVDDSAKNVATVKALQDRYPHAKIVVHQATEHAEEPSQKESPQPTQPDDGSAIAQQAKTMGLTDYRFGRYGKGGKVTHIVQNDRLIPKPNK